MQGSLMHLLASQLREHPLQSCPPLKLLGIVVTQPGILQPPRVGGVGGGVPARGFKLWAESRVGLHKSQLDDGVWAYDG